MLRREIGIKNMEAYRSKLIGSMILEFPQEVEDIAGVTAISLVTFAQSNGEVVKISLVYARESK